MSGKRTGRGACETRRSFLRKASAVGAAALAPRLLRGSPTPHMPNLVFFLGEGARWDESSLAGNRLLKTPAIDRIGREGAVFTNAFVATPWRSDWLYEYYEYPGDEQVRPCRGVRTERYKYIHYFTAPHEFELYDLQSDSDELHNLYGDARHAALARQLAARLEELRRETGDHYAYEPSPPPESIEEHVKQLLRRR